MFHFIQSIILESFKLLASQFHLLFPINIFNIFFWSLQLFSAKFIFKRRFNVYLVSHTSVLNP